jgi:hypothetical protein
VRLVDRDGILTHPPFLRTLGTFHNSVWFPLSVARVCSMLWTWWTEWPLLRTCQIARDLVF